MATCYNVSHSCSPRAVPQSQSVYRFILHLVDSESNVWKHQANPSKAYPSGFTAGGIATTGLHFWGLQLELKRDKEREFGNVMDGPGKRE